jgi:hypothetical protein
VWFAILGFRPVDDPLGGIPLINMQGSNFFHPLSPSARDICWRDLATRLMAWRMAPSVRPGMVIFTVRLLGSIGGCNWGRYALQISKTKSKPSPVNFNENDSDSKGLSAIEREQN